MFYGSGVLWKLRLQRKEGSGLPSTGTAGSLPCGPDPAWDTGTRGRAPPHLLPSSPPPWLLTCLQPSSLRLPGLPGRPTSAHSPSVSFRMGVASGGHVSVPFAVGKRGAAAKRGPRSEV